MRAPHCWLTVALLLPVAAPLAQLESGDDEFEHLLAPLEGTTPAQWRVVWTTDPAHEATISWSTAEPGTEHRVHWDSRAPGSGGAEYEQVSPSARDGRYSTSTADAQPAAHYHHVRLRGLAPATTYRFRIESDGVRSPELHFVTAPDDDRPLSLLAGGDSRSGWRARCFVNRAMARELENDPGLLGLCHGGDYIFDGLRWDHWTAWLSHHELTTTSAGRVLPVIPTRGNHDRGPLYGEIFDAPGGAQRDYYTTQLGSAVRLLTLDSNIAAGGDQLEWLRNELSGVGAETRWLVTNYHRPLYPAVKSPGAALPFWPPLFDQYGVDLALESDGHCIKRTCPIRDNQPHPEGVVYVGEGGLGVPQRVPRTDPWYLAEGGLAQAGHHVVRLDFGREELRVRFLELDELPAEQAQWEAAPVIARNASWRYATGAIPNADWASPAFDDADWSTGNAGFGYGDEDDTTVLEDMRGNYDRVRLRARFESAALEGHSTLSLLCRFDDAFIAYLNGVEIARGGLEPGADPDVRGAIASHEAREEEVFELVGWEALVREGENVFALVGYNRMQSDRDFSLDPWLAADLRQGTSTVELGFHLLDDTRLARRQR